MIFSPVIYEHAARFTGKSPWEVSRNADLLAEAHILAYHEYRHSPVTVGIDIYNLEAEAYGALVQEQTDNEVPSLAGVRFSNPMDILDLDRIDIHSHGRWPLILDAAKTIQEKLPDADVRIPLGGPFSIAANLAGFESFLMFSIMEEESTSRILMKLAKNQVFLASQILEAGFGISFFESAATPPMLSPGVFRRIELPPLKLILQELKNLSGLKAALIMGGDTAVLSRDLAESGAGFLICPSETDQELFMKNLAGINIPVRINMDAGIVSSGDWELIVREADRVKRLMLDFPGTFAGSGVLPYSADPVLIHRISELFSENPSKE